MALDIGELRGVLSLQDNFSGPVNDAAKQLGMFSASFATVAGFAGAAVAGIAAAGAAVVALGERGSTVNDVRGAFEGLTSAAGESADVMLGELRAGTMGTISDFDLMKQANATLGSGLVKSAADMGTLAKGAQLLADRTGGDTAEAFNTLTSAMASGKTASLKQLGVFVDSKVAVEQYAASIGKSAGELTGAEKAQALSAATLAKLREEITKNGPATADFADVIGKGRAAVANFVDGLSAGVAASPVLMTGLQGVGQVIEVAFGSNQKGLIETLVGWINKFAIFVADAASVGVEGARFISNAWNGLNVIFNTIMQGLAVALSTVAGGIASMLDVASKIPGVGDSFKGSAESVRAFSEDIEHLSTGFSAQADEALDNAARQHAALDSVKSAINTVRDAMVAAQGVQVETNEAVKSFGGASEEAATRSVENSHKIAEAFRTVQGEISLIGRTGIDERLAQLDLAREKEILGLKQLKEASGAEYEGLVALVTEKYQKMAEAAQLGSDMIRDTTLKLEEEIALAQTAGLERRLLELDYARDAELTALAVIKERYGADYEDLVALTNEKFDQMKNAASGHSQTVQQLAEQAGFKSREQLEQTARVAEETYSKMKESGLFTENAVRSAKEKAEEAKREAAGKTAEFQMTSNEALAQGALQIFGVLGEKHKSAAIAGAVLATYLSISKALASAPFPANLALAAGAAAVGWSNVSKIRSADPGYRFGTSDTAFEDFGRGAVTTLHGEEAVVTKAQAHSVGGVIADMVGEALDARGASSSASVAYLYMDGLQVAKGVVRHMPRALAHAGVR